jgi:hypothetical protein
MFGPNRAAGVALENAGENSANKGEGNADGGDVELGRPVEIRRQIHLCPPFIVKGLSPYLNGEVRYQTREVLRSVSKGYGERSGTQCNR